MKAIKYTLYAIAGVLVLLVLGGVIFAMTFNPNRYKGQIEDLVKEQTGRTLKLRGDLELAFWPALGAKVNGVSLSERTGNEPFVSLDSAHASVAVMPLLKGQAIVDGIRVSGLKANIVKEKDGSFNFDDLLEGDGKPDDPKDRREAKRQAKKKAAQRKDEGGAPIAFDIASVRIERSSVRYLDKSTGQALEISDLDLRTGRIADKADGKLQLSLTARGKDPDVNAKVDLGGAYKFDLPAKAFELADLDAKVTGTAAGIRDLDLKLKGDVAANPGKSEYRVKDFALDVKGRQEKQNLEAHVAAPDLVIASDKARGRAVTADLTLKEAAREVQAKLKLSGVEGSARSLAIPQLSVDLHVTDPSLPQKNFRIPVNGSLKADLDKQTADADLHAKFDESNIQAKLGLAKFSPPAYRFDINIDRLNVDRYTGAEAKKKPAAAPAEKKSSEKPKPKAEEDTPVDLSFLKGLDAQGRLRAGALQVNGLKLSNLRAEVRASDGQLDLPHAANLYDGSVTGALTARADGRVAVKDSLTGVAIGPLLRDFAQKDMLEGKGNLSMDVNTSGKSVNAMKKALAGTARVQLKDGAIKGINLAEVMRKAKTALGSQQAREEASKAQQTDFSEMNASFVIKNGVAHNEDLDVKAPLFRITGRGDIDIGNSTIDYVTKAAVVASTKGQGGADLSQLAGLTVPVRLHGPLDAMQYDVQYGAVAADLARSKAGAQLKDKLNERLGIKKPEAGQPAQGSTTQGSNLDKLKGLLGR